MFKNFINATILKFIGAIFELLIQIYLTRKVSPELYGQYTYIIGTGALLFYLVFGGKIKYIIKNVAIGNSIAKFQRKYLIFYTFPVAIILLSIAILSKSQDFLNIVIFALLMHIFMEENSFLFGANKVTKALVTEYIVLKFFTLATIIICAVFYKVDLIIILICTYASYVISIVIQKIVTLKEENIPLNTEVQSPIKEIATFQVIEVFANTYSNIPRLLQYFIGGATQTAFFSIATIVRSILTFISGPTVKVFFNDFAKNHQANDIESLQINYRDSTRWQIYIIIPVFISITFCSELFLKVFGSAYMEAKSTVIIISIATFLSLFTGPTSNLFQMIGKENFELLSQFLSFVVFILCLMILLMFGIQELSVPLSFLASSVITTILRTIYLIKNCKIIPYNLKEFAFILSCIIFESLIIILINHFNYYMIICLMLYCILSVAFHFALSPNKSDRYFVRKIVDQTVKFLKI